MQKRKVMTGVLLGCVLLCTACGKKTTESDMDKSEVPAEEVTALSETTPAPSVETTPTPSVEATLVPTLAVSAALTPTATPEPTATPTPVPTSAPTPPLNPEVAYLELIPEEHWKVYVSTEQDNPQIIVERVLEQTVKYQVFDWEYDLAYGQPMVVYEEDKDLPENTGLRILLPTKELTTALSPVGAYEICGEEYYVNAALAGDRCTDNIAPELFEKDSVAEYRVKDDGERIFTLELSANGHMGQCFEYPDLELEPQETYPVVFEKVAHYTDSLLSYRRVGVQSGEDIVWLGKFCNDITGAADWLQMDTASNAYDYSFFPEKGQGYYVSERYYDVPSGERVYPWQPFALEPDALLDLDRDGTPEKISYRKVPNAEDRYSLDVVVCINDVEVHRERLRIFDPVADYPFAAQLDDEEYQLLLMDFGTGTDCGATIYQYENNTLLKAGYFSDIHYEMVEEDGRYVCYVTKSTHQLQHDAVERKYAFVEGMLQELPKEYYEFLEKWRDGDAPADRNVLTVIEDVELYTEKNGSETFLLPAGSHAVTLGGDLKEWILFENRDTGEQGWMRVKCDEYGNAFDCILPDGSVVDAFELFEGLRVYG